MRIRLQQFIVGVGMILLMTFLFVKTNVIESAAHYRFSLNLRRMKELDSKLAKDILESRYGLMTAYDSLITEVSELDKLCAELKNVPDFLEHDEQEKIGQLLDQFKALQSQKEQLIEQFKSRNAVINNSLRYFPFATSKLTQKIPVNNPKHDEVNNLLRDVLTYYLVTDTELEPTIANRIELLRKYEPEKLSDLHNADLNITISHANTILKLKPEVDDLVKQIVTLPTAEKLEEIIGFYNSYYNESVNQTDRYRLLLYVVSVLMLAYIGFIIVRLKKAKIALNVINESLEQRVMSRTADLEESNKELQGEIAERLRLQLEAEGISEVIQGVTTTSNLDELLAVIHQSIRKILDADNCYVSLFDPKTELLNMQFFVDKYDSVPPPSKLGTGLTAYVFRTEVPELITTEVIHHLTRSGEVEVVGTIPAVWLGVPLRTPNGVIGVLVVQHYENADAYDQRDLGFLSSIGDQIALAIERKRAEELQRQGEEQLQIFNQKLQQSNRELQDFAFVASHDLQEPLRKVQAFSDRLKTKYAANLEGEGLDYLERMRSAASRMQLLIQDLLSFSRVSTKAQPFAPVNLETVAREVLSDLEVKIEETGATVELIDLPTVDADPLQMRQLMQNLIGNALKFQQKETAPVISIHTQPTTSNGQIQISFTDNGIGFDEKYTDKIFAVFQRLHGRNEYEGSGVGLAICRKIVERHNGTITAHSIPNQGATFTVTLPIKQANAEN